MIKATVSVLAVGFGIGWAVNALSIDDDLQAKLDAECFAKYGEDTKGQNQFSSTLLCTMTDEYKEKQKLIADAEYAKEQERKAEEKRIAEAKAEAFRNSPEGKTQAFVRQASTQCRNDIRARAKYPSKVDFNWLDGNGERHWMNFNGTGESRVLINKAGEMMNGLGMMVPFTAACKYDYNPETNKYSVVEIIIS